MTKSTKQSHISTILYDEMSCIEHNKQYPYPKYISIDEYNFNMILKEYNDAQILKMKQEKKNNIFNAFFYIPIR